MSLLFRWIIRHPFWVLTLTFASTAFFGYQIKNLQVETDISAALPKSIPAKRLYDRMGQIFPSRDFVLVVVQSDSLFEPRVIGKIYRLTELLEDLPGVYSVLSPTNVKIIRGTEEGLEVREILDRPPQSPEEMEVYRQKLLGSDLFLENLISDDRKAAGIMVFLKKGVRERKVAEDILKLIERERGDLRILATGKPVVLYYLEQGMNRDMQRLFPLALIVVFFFPLVRFRKLKLVLLPIAVVVFSVIWTFGLMALVGSPLSHSTTILPILLISIGVADGIHILNHYFANSRFIRNREELVFFTMRELHAPVIMTSITTMVGFLALNTSRVESLLQLGIFTAYGVFVAMLLSLFFVPASLALMKVPTALKEKEGGLLERLSHRYAQFLIRFRKLVLAGILVIVGLSLVGIPQIVLESNDIENFRPDHPLRVAYEEINRRFAGSNTLDVMIEGSREGQIKEPRVMQQMALLEDYLRGLPEVGGALSLVDFMRRINKALHGDDPAYYRIPREVEEEEVVYVEEQGGRPVEVRERFQVRGRELIAQYLQLYEMSGKPEDLANLVDYNYQNAKITAFLKTTQRTRLLEIDRKVREFIRQKLSDLKADLTGTTELYLAVNELVVSGQFKSILVSLFLVYLLTAFMFRSPVAGLFNALPLFFGIFLNFAIMGWAGIRLNLMTMVTSSIAIGVGVDYAIHFYHRYQMKWSEQKDYQWATDRTMEEAGVAIFLNAITVAAGFAVLMFSTFKGIAEMGTLIFVTMLSTSFGALTILPTLFMTLKPTFREVRLS